MINENTDRHESILTGHATPDRDTTFSMFVFCHPIRDFISILPGRYSSHNTWTETLDARGEALRNCHIKQGER